MAPQPLRVAPKPGVQRDSTTFDSDSYVQAQWTRFYRNRAKKMGGYLSIVDSLTEIAYEIASYTSQNQTYIHLGSVGQINQVLVDSNGILIGLNDRTPAALPADANRLWQFEVLYNSVGGSNFIIAHGPGNLNDISNDVETPIYYGDVLTTGVLTNTGVAGESGGVAAVAPYLFKFGKNGHIAWCVPNKPNDFAGAGSGEAWVSPSKIVRGLPLRSSGNGPAAIFWALDSLIRGSFVGSSSGYWAFDTLGEISILSSRSVVEYSGNYYWLGVDRMQSFNGVIRDIDNEFNKDWFFKNLNFSQRQKVFAFKVPRYDEIWWCFPYGSSTVCDRAIVYNVRGNYWYDTTLPEGGRAAAIYAKVYSRPFMTGIQNAGGYSLWQHETGVNKVIGSQIDAIRAYFQTNEMSLIGGEEPKNKALRISRFEPDFVQSKALLLTVKGRANARAAELSSETFSFPDVATSAEEQTVPLKDTRRLMSLQIESNDVDGDFYMGKSVMHIEESDGRETQ